MADTTKVSDQEIREFIAKSLGVSIESATDDAELEKNLGADSLELTELVMNLEENFKIEVADDEAVQAKTAGQVIRLVQEKLAEKDV